MPRLARTDIECLLDATPTLEQGNAIKIPYPSARRAHSFRMAFYAYRRWYREDMATIGRNTDTYDDLVLTIEGTDVLVSRRPPLPPLETIKLPQS